MHTRRFARSPDSITWHRGRVGKLPFCIGRIWQGIEAMFRGLSPIPGLFALFSACSRLRRFRFCFGFVCAAVSRRQFSFASGVGSFVRRFRFC